MPRRQTSDQLKAKAVARQVRDRKIRTARVGNAREAIGKLTPGAEVYVLTFGQFSLIEAIEAILEQTGPAAIDLSTWTAAHADLQKSAAMMAQAEITRLRFVVDTSFVNRQPQYCARMRETFGDDCIRTMRSHAKFAAIYNDRWNIALRTSMNLNKNPRLENLEISDDPALCGFLRDIVDQVYDEHAAGDFQALLPNLERSENVETPGLVGQRYERPKMGAPLKTSRPTTGTFA